MTRAQYERCRLQGIAARQGGSPITANPYTGGVRRTHGWVEWCKTCRWLPEGVL